MAGAIGADVEQLRSLAKRFTTSADRLQQSSSGLSGAITNAAFWRGNDADQFRAQWRSQSNPSIATVVKSLRSAADALIRNADEQDRASGAGGGGTGAAGTTAGPSGDSSHAPESTRQLWDNIHRFQDKEHSSGYHVQKVVGADGTIRYIVYITGTEMSLDGQSWPANLDAIDGQPDSKMVKALQNLIKPPDAEVMLVGYSQGGMDAQNIAHQKNLFNVKQVVTFGSPVRNDIDIPSIHMQASTDLVPNIATILPGVQAGVDAARGGLLGGVKGAIEGAIGGTVKAVTSPYAPIYNIKTNPNYGIYTAKVDGNPHASYDQVADKYDQAVSTVGVPPQGAQMAAFAGTVTEIDIGTDGKPVGSGGW